MESRADYSYILQSKVAVLSRLRFPFGQAERSFFSPKFSELPWSFGWNCFTGFHGVSPATSFNSERKGKTFGYKLMELASDAFDHRGSLVTYWSRWMHWVRLANRRSETAACYLQEFSLRMLHCRFIAASLLESLHCRFTRSSSFQILNADLHR